MEEDRRLNVSYRTIHMDRRRVHHVGNFEGAELDRKVRYLVHEQNHVIYVEVDGKCVWFYETGWAKWWIALFPRVDRIDDLTRCPPPMTEMERAQFHKLNRDLNEI